MIASLAAVALAANADYGPRRLADLYLAWRGGSKFERLAAIHASGAIRVMGLEGRIDRWSTAAGGEREDRDLRVFMVGEGNGPDGGWSRGPGGQVDRLSSLARAALAEDAEIDFGGAFRNAPGVVLAEAGDEAQDGRTWKVLRATFSSGARYDLLVDGTTGELEGERITRDGRTTTVKLSEWRMVDGVRIAFREEASGALPGQTRQVAYSDVQLNVQPGAALLAVPAPRRIAKFEAGRTTTGPLPLRIFDDRRIFVDVEIGGRKVAAMIDSGAAGSVVDAGFAVSAGVRSSGGGVAVGAAGTAAVAIGSAADVRIGNLTLVALPLAVMDLSGISTQIGRPLEMVIGRDLFDQTVVTIDARDGTITLSDPATFKPDERAIAVPIESEGPLRTVSASIEGGRPATLHFDIGNGTPLVLYPAYWRRLGLAEGRRASKTLVGGIGGSVAADVTAVSSLNFGGTLFRDVPTILMPATGGAGDTGRVDGNLGFPVLSRFRFSVDYAHDRLWLAPAPGVVRAFERDRSGLGVQSGPSALTVMLVAPNSPAATAGLHTGDAVVAVDDRTVGPDYVASGLSRWRNGPAGRIVTLRLADGTTRSLTLADTY